MNLETWAEIAGYALPVLAGYGLVVGFFVWFSQMLRRRRDSEDLIEAIVPENADVVDEVALIDQAMHEALLRREASAEPPE